LTQNPHGEIEEAHRELIQTVVRSKSACARTSDDTHFNDAQPDGSNLTRWTVMTARTSIEEN